MRMIVLLLLLWLPCLAQAQSSTVLPAEVSLSVMVDTETEDLLTREMVLITITGVYTRHITREQLIQPDLEGFNWTQLGPDHWSEERRDGRLVKVFKRRMAVYPDRPGTLTIGSFVHELTLTDEGDNWFVHPVRSEPVSISVKPAPASDEWWFPVHDLKISDQWSNAPDQLQPGEGVLRVIRIEALGVTPEMIPPMPQLRSPSGQIFPHPEKRFVELSPRGPLTYAFWRWTIRPSNSTSTIVEPITFSYFDTKTRTPRSVTISAQRVAYGAFVPEAGAVRATDDVAQATPATLPGWPIALVAALVFCAGVVLTLADRRLVGAAALHRFSLLDPLARQLRQAARKGQTDAARRVARAILRRDGASPARQELLRALDRALFDPHASSPSLSEFAAAFLKSPSGDAATSYPAHA